MPVLVGYLLLFVGLAVFFVFIHLVIGKVIRPIKPDAEKLTIYECGEPTIGSAWIQFDVRFYVVALLFVMFDVEVAFFFPWAVVFGKTNELARADLPIERRLVLTREIDPTALQKRDELVRENDKLRSQSGGDVGQQKLSQEMATFDHQLAERQIAAARNFGWIAFGDILVFFGVLLVGYAYLWKRGDLEWVRSMSAEAGTEVAAEARDRGTLVGAGS